MSVHLARGTRDILPTQAARRHWVIEQLRAVFVRHGFEPLETPAFERIETLAGKYGEEGQKLMFRILKRGAGAERGECDLALRYDLTVPLARFIAMNPGVRLPFKRFQVAPVWRAERPARGRFREFWQFDGDIVGSEEPLADAQCLAVAADALTTLGFRSFTIRLNDRRLLRALARAAGAGPDRETALLVAVDKLDKVGRDRVDAELEGRGFDAEQRAAVWRVLELEGSNEAILDALVGALGGGEEVVAATQQLTEVMAMAEGLGVPVGALKVDPTLARGLDYYTGPVFEVVVDEPAIGSIAGGGRYDELIGSLSKQPRAAVGVALGLERILMVMEELEMFGAQRAGVEALVTVYDAAHRTLAIEAAAALRRAGIAVDLYVGSGSLKSQLKYANAKGIPWIIMIGPSEAEAGVLALKDMAQGTQEVLPIASAIARIQGSDVR